MAGLHRVRLIVASAVSLVLAACNSSPEQKIADKVADAAADFKPPSKPELQPMLGQVLDQLSHDVPEIAKQKAEIVANEKALLAEASSSLMPAEPVDAKATKVSYYDAGPQFAAEPAGGGIASWIIPAAHAQGGGGPQVGLMPGFSGASILGGTAGKAGRGQSGSDSKTFTGKGGEKVTVSRTIANGETTTSVSSNVDIPQLGATAGGTTSVTTQQMCPDSEGRVNLTMRLTTKGTAGAASYSSDLEAKIAIVVGDKAEILSTDIQAKFDSRANGAAGKASVAGTLHTVGDSDGDLKVEGSKVSDASGDFKDLHNATMNDVMTLANGAIAGASSHWMTGYCVRIAATSPGNVKPGAVSDIDVKTFSQVDGEEIRSNVTAALSGGESVDPAAFTSAGKLKHTAVNKKNATMTIKLTAVSRRGIATQTLEITTNLGQYFAEGGGGEFHGTGAICDITKPFTIAGSGISVKFTPSSKDGGTYSYTGNAGGAALYGGDSYSVKYDGDVAVAINGGGVGCAETPLGTACNSGTEEYKLTKAKEGQCE